MKIAVVVDPWDYPFNGTVVSTRRFVKAMSESKAEPIAESTTGAVSKSKAETKVFQILACETAENSRLGSVTGFDEISLPGFNGILKSMKVPLAKPDRIKIERAIKDCDLVHIQFPFFLGYSVISAAKRMGVPVICSFHVQPENLLLNVGIRSRLLTNLLYKLFMRWFYNRADIVVAPSQFAADLLKKHGLRQPVKVISNGVPDEFFSEVSVQSKPSEKTTEFNIVSVGRLAKEKQQTVLLEAIAASSYKNRVRLQLIGTGPMEDELKQRMVDLGIHGEIGRVYDQQLMQAYVDADLFVHAGDVELEGMSVMEAMAAGNAVLISDSPDSAAALLAVDDRASFRHGDAKDLRAKMEFLLDNPDQLNNLAQANRAKAESHRLHISVAQFDESYRMVVRQARLSNPMLDQSIMD